jgi:hypothetical protein
VRKAANTRRSRYVHAPVNLRCVGMGARHESAVDPLLNQHTQLLPEKAVLDLA